MTKRDKDLVILAVLAYFLLRKKGDAPAPVPVVVAPSVPHPLTTPVTTASTPEGQIEVRRADGSGPVTAPITHDDDNEPNAPITSPGQ